MFYNWDIFEVEAIPYVSVSVPVSVPVSVILNYTLPQYCIRFLVVWALFREIIHYINDKCHHYDVSTIRGRDKICIKPYHPYTDTG